MGNRWLLTASHCVDVESSKSEERYKIGVGSPDSGQLNWKFVQKVHKYPVWKDWNFAGRFDIALLEVNCLNE